MALLDGKVAVITGAGRGIGREEALLMAKHGAKVVVNDLGGHFDGTGQSRSPAEDVVKEIRAAGGEAVANFESVTDFKAAKRIIECAIDNFGKLNIVVNNAGILRDRMIFNMTEEDWDAVVAVHLKGSFNVARHARATGASSTRPATCSTAASSTPAPTPASSATPGRATTARPRPRSPRWRSSSTARCSVTASPPTRSRRSRAPALPSTRPRRPPPAWRRKAGEFDAFTPAHVAPLVAWLGQRRRQRRARRSVPRRHGHRVADAGMAFGGAQGLEEGPMWEPAELGAKLKEELAKGVTKKESMGRVMAGGV